jgi:hypothetical protein
VKNTEVVPAIIPENKLWMGVSPAFLSVDVVFVLVSGNGAVLQV